MISAESIEQIRAIALEDAVRAYHIELKKSGTGFRACSPWSEEKTPSFYVSPKKNIFKDFSTGKGGTGPISFVMLKENCDYVEACKILANQHGITLQFDGKSDPEPAADRIAVKDALGWALAHFAAADIPEDFKARRALPESICEAFQLGYAPPGWDNLLKSAKKAGIGPDILVKAGLIKKRENKSGYYDTFRDRVIIPIVNHNGGIIGFSGRDAETVKKKDKEEAAKYCHTEGMEKSKHLYGLFQALAGGKITEGAYLVEGTFDVQRFHVYAVTNAIGMLGSSLSDDQAKLLRRFTDKIILVPDNDLDKFPKNPGIESMKNNAATALRFGFAVKYLIPGQ